MIIGNRSPFTAASARILALYMLVTSLLLSTASLGRSPALKNPKVTPQQIDALLKSDPTITTGFKTPDGATVHLERRIPGGVVLRFASPGNTGNATVTGPQQIMKKSFWSMVIDLGKKLTDISNGKPGNSSSGTCNINVDVEGDDNVINVQCTPPPQ